MDRPDFEKRKLRAKLEADMAAFEKKHGPVKELDSSHNKNYEGLCLKKYNSQERARQRARQNKSSPTV